MPIARATVSTQNPRAIRATVTGRGRKFSRRSEALLLKEVSALKELVGNLTARVVELEQEAEANKTAQSADVIMIREISKEQAREEIIHAFESGQPLDHADLADELSLEISLVFEVCNQLIEEGVVVFYDDDRS